MKISGIICEYNPFHNGHLYHIKKTRENGATHIAAVMSGNFVQRGETAIINKFDRAQLAARCGIDLVVELPTPYSIASAEFFAKGAVYILDSLGCVEELSFGSEVGSVEEITKAAEMVLECQHLPELEEYLKNGMSYPNAINNIVLSKYGSRLGNRVGEILSHPNNILAVEYIKALKHFNSKIKPFTVPRKSAAHDSMTTSGNNIASASYIRKCISEHSDFFGLVPDSVYSVCQNVLNSGKKSDIKNLERILIYKLRTISPEELRNVPDVGQGLENRILQCASLDNIEDIFNNIKTKRYTMARIKRIFYNMLIGIKKSDLQIFPPYIRVLAVTERGRDILSLAKQNSTLPVSTSLAKLEKTCRNAKRFGEIEATASDIYALSQKKIGRGKIDYKTKFSIEMELDE